MKDNLEKQIDEIFSELIDMLSSLSPEDINVVPFEGSWTAGQLAQHLIMATGGFEEIVKGPTRETKGDPGEKIESIREVFLNFKIKMNSPDFIVPPATKYDQGRVIDSLKNIRRSIVNTLLLPSIDLSRTCLSFEVPVLGYLTGLELAHFILYHTQRHVRQLKNILEKLNSNKKEVVQ